MMVVGDLAGKKVTDNKKYKRWKMIVTQFDFKTFFFVFLNPFEVVKVGTKFPKNALKG